MLVRNVTSYGHPLRHNIFKSLPHHLFVVCSYKGYSPPTSACVFCVAYRVHVQGNLRLAEVWWQFFQRRLPLAYNGIQIPARDIYRNVPLQQGTCNIADNGIYNIFVRSPAAAFLPQRIDCPEVPSMFKGIPTTTRCIRSSSTIPRNRRI